MAGSTPSLRRLRMVRRNHSWASPPYALHGHPWFVEMQPTCRLLKRSQSLTAAEPLAIIARTRIGTLKSIAENYQAQTISSNKHFELGRCSMSQNGWAIWRLEGHRFQEAQYSPHVFITITFPRLWNCQFYTLQSFWKPWGYDSAERMHLLTFMQMKKPGPLFRGFVLLTQVKLQPGHSNLPSF